MKNLVWKFFSLVNRIFKLLPGPEKRLLRVEELEKVWSICLFQFWKES